MRRPPVRMWDLELAMEVRPEEFGEGAQTFYLDTQTGELVPVYEDDEEFGEIANADPSENAARREAVEADPDRYPMVPGLDVGDDNEMLVEFLNSDWTGDGAKRAWALEAYGGSVGLWKKAVRDDEETLSAWHDFEAGATRRRALAFLGEHGIEPVEPERA